MKKRIVCMLLALLLLVGMLPVGVFADNSIDYAANKGKKARFLYDLNVSASPETEIDWSSTAKIPLTDVSDLVVIIDDCKVLVEQNEVWYKVKALDGETLPDCLKDMWIFHDTYNTSLGATIEFACGTCDNFGCTSEHKNWCETCKKDDCGSDHNATEPTEPECGCCDACIDAEGCTCGCETCKFVQKEETTTITEEYDGHSFAASGNIPEGADLVISPATSLPDAFVDLDEGESFYAYDISIMLDGAEWQPSEKVTVTIEGITLYENPYIVVDHALDSVSAIQNGQGGMITNSTLVALFPKEQQAAFEATGVSGAIYAESFNSAIGTVWVVGNDAIAFETGSFSTYYIRSGNSTTPATNTSSSRILPTEGEPGTEDEWYVRSDDKAEQTFYFEGDSKTFWTDSKKWWSFHFMGVPGTVLTDTSGTTLISSAGVESSKVEDVNLVIPKNASAGQIKLRCYTTAGNGGLFGWKGGIIINVIVPFSIIFDAGSGEINGQSKVTYSDRVKYWPYDTDNNPSVTCPTPTRTAYDFDKWEGKLDDDDNTTYGNYTAGQNLTYTGDTNLTFTAKWNAHPYTATFVDSNGNSVATAKTYNIEGALTLPSTATAPAGYELNYWKVASTVGNWSADSTHSGTVAAGKYGDVTFTAVWKAKTDTKYTVETYTQNITDNNYTKTGSVEKTGTTGTTPTISTTAASGFTYNATKSTVTGTIAGNGTTVYKVYFDREKYTVTLTKDTGIASVTGAGTYKYEEPVTISATVAQGYGWKNWTGTSTQTAQSYSFKMPASNVSYAANTTANTNTKYTVETYTQNIADNNYTKTSSVEKTGTTGTTPTISTTAASGFTYNATKSTVTGTIAGNGTTVYKVYFDREKYTVTLTKDIGIASVTGAGTYKYEEPVTINATVSDGYKWKNWTGYNTQTTQNYSFTMPASNVPYTANAEKISYTVTFDMQGATSSSIANKTLTWDEQYTLPTPEKKYTVTYDHNYAVSGTQVKTSATAQATFLGWEDQGSIVCEGTTWKYTDFDAPFYGNNSGDVILYWGPCNGHYSKYGLLTHFIEWGQGEYANGSTDRKPAPTGDDEPGRYPIGAVVSNLSTTDGYPVPLIAGWSDVSSVTLPTPTRTGYTFGGWYTDATCSAANKVTGTTYTPTSSVTLYAKWTPDTREVTYKYEGTVPSGAPAVPAKANVMPGTSTKVAEVPSLAGYTFSGWNTSDATVSKGSFTMPDKAVTFTGDWAENTYNISYDLDEGELDENDENPATYQADSANFTLHNPKKDGYEFTGWTESISTTNWTNGFINLDTGACETYNAGYPNSVYSEKIFLEAGVTYKLEGTNLNGIRWRYFDTNGNFLGNKSLDDTFTPDVDGYVQILLYEGCTEANRNAAKITSSQGTTVLVKTGSTGDRAYTANWSVNTYTITYNHNDVTSGDPTITTDTYTIEEALTLAEAPTREGYKFTGWELEDDVTEPDGNWKADTYSAAQEFKKGKYGDIELVAQWEEQYRYELKFDANGGSGAPESITKEWCDDKEYTFTWTKVPTRTGYTFMGWAEDAASEENVAGADKNSIKLDGEAAETVTKTIFAIWKRDTGTIQLNYSGGVPVVVTVTCTDAVNDEEKITINTVVTSNTTIKDLPTGTYKVTAESGNANYTAYVNPGSTLLKSGETANFDLSVSDEGFNWLTGFAHVINKRGG